jgi:cytochrome b6-f complex iron-sulfur subunit
MADTNKRAPAGAAAPPASAAAGPDGITRRQMLRSSMFATVGALFATMGAGAGGMFWPIKITGFGAPIPATKKLSEMKVGDVELVRKGKYYLTRTDEGLMALYWKCVHLGCTVPYVEARHQFVCPCHGSVYETTGQNVAGPAPRPLDYMAIEISGDDIIVNTGKITARPKHLPEHATKV